MARIEEAGKTGVTGAGSGPSSAIVSTGIASAGEVTIRKCEALEDMRACFELQKEVWKFSDPELVPVRLFVVAAKIGGQVIGAFVPRSEERNNAKDDERNDQRSDERNDENELVGFALAIPGMRNGHPYLHSQMLAVR